MGAASGRFRPGWADTVDRFLNSVKADWHPAAWLNPMPRDRWRSSDAGPLARSLRVSMWPLDAEGVVRSVDYLRGYGEA